MAEGSAPTAESFTPTAEGNVSPVNIDPVLHLPADGGNGFARAFRILFRKAV